MKKFNYVKIFIILLFTLLVIATNHVYGATKILKIKIIGNDNERYQVGLCLKVETDEYIKDVEEINDITTYSDLDGYKYVSLYTNFKTTSSLEYVMNDYDTFKIVILNEDNLLLVTNEVKLYAYNSYYEINLKDKIYNVNNNKLDIISNYNYQVDILQIIIRIMLIGFITLSIMAIYKVNNKEVVFPTILINGVIYITINIITTIISYNYSDDVGSNMFIIMGLVSIIILLLFNFFYIKKRLTIIKSNQISYLIICAVVPLLVNFIILLMLG